MGRNSGGVVNISHGGAGGKNAQIVIQAVQKSRPLSDIKDKQTYNEIFRGVSRFEAVMGVRERSVRIANLDSMNALGVTYIKGDGKSNGILLNSTFFDRKKSAIEHDVKTKHYDTGFKNRTNAPLQHTITHELAHATWNASMQTASAKAAGKEITALYHRFLGDKKKKGYGSYGKTNVSEFWAEAVTKAIHGKADKYTKRVKNIARKYNL
jgi:hypothetical protein